MRLSRLILALVVSGAQPTLSATAALPLDLAAENRLLVQRLVLDRAAAIATMRRLADERETRLFADFADKDHRLRREIQHRRAAMEVLVQITAERQRLVDQIAVRDNRFAAEIAEYRRQIASIADSPDPRKRAALELYADGDRAGGYSALVEIQKAEQRAVAAGWREIAALSRDRRTRGESSTAEVTQFFETAQRIDSDNTWGWIELQRLYQEAGRLADARRAAEQALAHACSERDRAFAEASLGAVLAEEGDLAGSRAHFDTTLNTLARLASADATSTQAQQDLSVGMVQLGEALLKAGDLAAAQAQFEASAKIRARLGTPDDTGGKISSRRRQ